MPTIPQLSAKAHHLAERIDTVITAQASKWSTNDSNWTSQNSFNGTQNSWNAQVNTFIGNFNGGWANVALYAGWTTYSGRLLRARLADNARSAFINGQIAPGTVEDGTIIGYVGPPLQPWYRPVTVQIGIPFDTTTKTNYRIPYIEIEENGNLQIYGWGTGAQNGHGVINGVYPLDC